MPRLLRLARCQGYASFACGCGGIWCPCLQRSPTGGSTLMTSAPKSDRITAALGPAMKLARSTTLSPEKMLSLAIGYLPNRRELRISSPLELGRALFEEGGRALLLVLGGSAKSEVGSLEQQAFVLARLQPLVHRLERELDGDRSIGYDLVQDRFGAGDQIGRRNHFVDEPDTKGLLRADHLPGKNELERAALADQPRQTLRSAAARNESQGDLGLAELRGVHREPDGAGHRGLAATAERKAVDGRDHRLAEIFDQIEHLLSEPARLLRFERRDPRKLADVCAGDERLVAGARQDDAAYCTVVPRILERRSQILPGRRIQ